MTMTLHIDDSGESGMNTLLVCSVMKAGICDRLPHKTRASLQHMRSTNDKTNKSTDIELHAKNL